MAPALLVANSVQHNSCLWLYKWHTVYSTTHVCGFTSGTQCTAQLMFVASHQRRSIMNDYDSCFQIFEVKLQVPDGLS